jgi:potassium channel subfamily K
MGLLPVVLASLLIPRTEGGHSGVPDEGHRDDSVNDDKEQSPDLESKIADCEKPIQDSDPQSADEDEPDEPSPPGHRVTFRTTLSGSSDPSLEKTPANPGLWQKLKSIIFPSQDEDKPLSHHRILPVVSGLVIPFSILLEIPGLTERWYIRTDGNVVVESRPNPASFDAMLAISMIFGVLANVALICRFLEKGPVLATTLITMAFLTIHGNPHLWSLPLTAPHVPIDSINIIAVVVFGVQHRFDDGFTYGHGYWMTGKFAIFIRAFSPTYR